MQEEWRSLPEWEGGYEVSSLGRLKSLARNSPVRRPNGRWDLIKRREKIMSPFPNAKGYLCTTLSFGGKRKTMAVVHHLVASAFLGPRPPGALVCHSNGNLSDNRADNLRYDTPQGNQADRDIHGRTRKWERHHRAVLTSDQVREIRATYDGRETYFMGKYGIGRSTLRNVLLGISWKGV